MMEPSLRHLRRTGRFLTACALVLAAAGFQSAAAQTCGDVNGSNTVTTSDALSVLRVAVGQNVALECSGDCTTLEPRVTTLESSIASAQAAIASLTGQLDAANAMIAELADVLDGVSRTGDAIVFSGINLQVVDGSGGTAGPVNGKGNVIIGYNEKAGGQAHTGSHNLVVGLENEYTSFAGIVAGEENTISNRGATVVGGAGNVASGLNSSVCGGSDNTASGTYAAVGAGFANQASGINSTVSGGCENTASNTFAAVSGGQAASASGQWSSVTGGYNNKATTTHAAVSGGNTHTANGAYDWRAGTLFEDQ